VIITTYIDLQNTLKPLTSQSPDYVKPVWGGGRGSDTAGREGKELD